MTPIDDLLSSNADERVLIALSRLYSHPVPGAALDKRILPALRRRPVRRGSPWSLPRPRLRYGLPAVVAAVAVGAALLVSTTLEAPGSPTVVSAQTILKRMARAVLPPPLHSTEFTYTVRLGCPAASQCPVAVARRWTSNLRGVYVAGSHLRLDTSSMLGRQIFRHETYETHTSAFKRSSATMRSAGLGLQLNVSPRAWRRLERRMPVLRLFGAYGGAWDSVDWLDNAVGPGSHQFESVSSLQLGRPWGLPAPKLVSFDGQRALLLRLPGMPQRQVNERIYVDPKSYLILGMRASTCAVEKRFGHDGLPSPCLRWVGTLVVLRNTHAVPTCQAPGWSYRWYFRAMLAHGNGLPLRTDRCTK